MAGVAALAMRPKVAPGTKPMDDEEGNDPMTKPGKFENQDKVLAVGTAQSADVAPLLDEIRKKWTAAGIDPALLTPEQFYVMPEAPKQNGAPVLAIASRATWDRTVQFITTALAPVLRDVLRRGVKRSQFRIGGFREGHGSDGYGTGSYNKAVGGAPGSRHVDGDGADIIPTGGSGVGDRILMAIARFKVDNPSMPIGFGAYSNRGHVDIGGRRNWDGKSVPGNADRYLERARRESRIA